MEHRLSFFLGLIFFTVGALGSRVAVGDIVKIPLISVACHLQSPAPGIERANGYDCTVGHAIETGFAEVDSELSPIERVLVRARYWMDLHRKAEKSCGDTCRLFAGASAFQCLAIAQSPGFTGIGSFMGKETVQADAERSAIQACERYVGLPGATCSIVVSVCAPRLVRP